MNQVKTVKSYKDIIWNIIFDSLWNHQLFMQDLIEWMSIFIEGLVRITKCIQDANDLKCIGNNELIDLCNNFQSLFLQTKVWGINNIHIFKISLQLKLFYFRWIHWIRLTFTSFIDFIMYFPFYFSFPRLFCFWVILLLSLGLLSLFWSGQLSNQTFKCFWEVHLLLLNLHLFSFF